MSKVIAILLIVGLIALTAYMLVGLIKDIKKRIKSKKEGKK